VAKQLRDPRGGIPFFAPQSSEKGAVAKSMTWLHEEFHRLVESLSQVD